MYIRQRKLGIIPALLCLAYLQGCATVAGPINAAETVEQRAFAAYGTFVVFEELGAGLINDTRIDADARRAIQRADAVVKPIADSTLVVALEVNQLRGDLTALDREDRLAATVDNLETWLARLEPAVQDLVSSIKGAR